MILSKSMELLVHIGASASRKEDGRYLAQAAAYLNFKPSALLRNRLQECPKDVEDDIVQAQVKEQARAEVMGPDVLSRNRSGFLRPKSSPMERLEKMQEQWRRTSGQSKRPRPIDRTQTDSNIIFNTQFAVSALESQLISQSENERFPIAVKLPEEFPVPSAKRMRLSNSAELVDDGSTSLEIVVPRSMPGQGYEIAKHDSAPEGRAPPPQTPQPDSMNSMLPSDYGLSATTTQTSQLVTQRPRDASKDVFAADLPAGQTSPSATQVRRSPVPQDEDDHPAEAGPRIDVVRVTGPQQTEADLPELAVPNIFPAMTSPEYAKSTAVEKRLPSPLPARLAGRDLELDNAHGYSAMAQKAHGKQLPASGAISKSPADQRSGQIPVASSSQLAPGESSPPAPSQQTLKTAQFMSEAHAPPPRISNAMGGLPSQITRALADVVSTPKMVRAYSPELTSRTIQPDERGYWEFDTSPWPAEVPGPFWRYLCACICQGNLGWSVWCRRNVESITDAEQVRNAGGDGEPEVLHPESERPGVVRVWCFGEVVMHIYLALYACSDNKIKLSRAQWLDTDGKVVVQMPTHWSQGKQPQK